MKIRYVFEGFIVAGAIWLCLQPTYKEGMEAGLQTGWSSGFEAGLDTFANASANLGQVARVYGQVHNAPWNELRIEEKMLLCAYGCSGNKFTNADIDEIFKKYYR